MRTAVRIAAALVVAICGCATAPEQPNAAMFRRGEAVEFYDFGLGVSHAGEEAAARIDDCSNDRFHCFAGVSVLIAPRWCSDLRDLVRSSQPWRVGDAAQARFLFLSEQQLYYASQMTRGEASGRSNGAAGFVYDVERGIVGVWRSPAAARAPLDRAAMREIVDNTKWLESPATLFACRR